MVIGYTRKVGLRKSKPSGARLARDMLEQVSRKSAAYWLRDQVRRSAATLDGLPPEMRETLAHRTRGRVVKPVPVVASDEFARNWDAPLPPDDLPLSCPHCPCTQTTECCYCDGTRTPLEDE